MLIRAFGAQCCKKELGFSRPPFWRGKGPRPGLAHGTQPANLDMQEWKDRPKTTAAALMIAVATEFRPKQNGIGADSGV